MSNRIYFASMQVGLKPDGNTGAYNVLHGVQSIGKTVNFNSEPNFELGQLDIYQLTEQIPDVQLTMNKHLDGYPLMYHRATQNATSPSLVGRSNEKTIFGMSIFPDTNDSAEGTPDEVVESSGCFVSSLALTFNLDGPSTEDLTLVSNDIIWKNDPKILNSAALARSSALTFNGVFTSVDSPIGLGGLSYRQHVRFDYDASYGVDVNGQVADPDATILPREVQGISSSGTNELVNNVYGAHINSISVSVDLGRENINELGRKGPYHRFVTFPIEISCEIETTATRGDLISATEQGILATGTGVCDRIGDNTRNRTIRIATCEGTRVYLGTKCRLASSNFTGGDTGGGNVTTSYSFTTYNTMTILHSGDPNASGSLWWTNRATYLVN